MKFAIYTLGCKVNQADSQSMQEILIKAGYEFVAPEAGADIYIINTCVVTNVGQQKSRQTIRKFIRENPNAMIIVTGCYPQTAIGEVEGIPGVALIIGNKDRHKIAELIVEYQQENSTEPLNIVSDINMIHNFEDIPTGMHSEKTRAFLKIQEGCNQFCTYCIIPYARGRLRSRSLTSIKKEIENLVASGYKEVVLLGIHLGAYGKDFSEKISLVNAVKTALAVPGLERLRLGSLECIEIEDEMLELLATESRLAKHLHLPLQSGSDSILRKMNRPYTVDEYRILIEKIRKKVPEIAITTDVIAGFPGETENLFQETYKFMEELQFSKTHIFPFSRRKNTPAEKYPQQVLKEIKQQRVKQLTFLDQKSHESFLNMNKNKEEFVLFEQQKYGYFTGYTSNYIRVYVNSDSVNLENKLYSVITQDVFKDGLMAVLK